MSVKQQLAVETLQLWAPLSYQVSFAMLCYDLLVKLLVSMIASLIKRISLKVETVLN